MGVLEVKDRVQRMLSEIVGVVQIDGDGDFTFSYESTRIWVSAYWWEPQELTVVNVYAIPLWNVPGSPEFFERITREAYDMRFGALSLYKREDGLYNVNFRHALVGETLDPEELKTAVLAVAYTADNLDDELQKEFGGQRWADLGNDG